jgi:hypothetical protein
VKPETSGKFRPTKARLKRVRMLKEYIIKAIYSDIRPKRKKDNEPLEPSEVPISRHWNVVMVSVTMKDREMFRRRLKDLQEEEKSIEAALRARHSWRKTVIKPRAKNSAKKGSTK